MSDRPSLLFAVVDDKGIPLSFPRLVAGERLIQLRQTKNGWLLDDPNDIAYVRAALSVSA